MPVIRDSASGASTSMHDAGILTLKQRIALVAGTGVELSNAAQMPDENFTLSFFLSNGIRCKNLSVAKMTPQMLKARGANTARDLRMLEYDALHLTDAGFCAGCLAAYGAEEILTEFLIAPADAVALAGSPAVHQLGLDVGTLLVVCAGAAVEAAAVLSQSLPRGSCLVGVAPLTLLDTGLRAQTLRDLGYSADAVMAQTRCSPLELKKLGF